MLSQKWYHVSMIRTQIQLTPEDYKALKQAAREEGRSMADCIREGIRLFLGRRLARGGDLGAVAGKYRPLPMDDLKPHDRQLADVIRQSKSADVDPAPRAELSVESGV